MESGVQSSWLCSPRIYLKKTLSESQTVLDMCKILYEKGYLDKYLKPTFPNTLMIRESEKLGVSNIPSSISNDSKSTMLTG